MVSSLEEGRNTSLLSRCLWLERESKRFQEVLYGGRFSWDRSFLAHALV